MSRFICSAWVFNLISSVLSSSLITLIRTFSSAQHGNMIGVSRHEPTIVFLRQFVTTTQSHHTPPNTPVRLWDWGLFLDDGIVSLATTSRARTPSANHVVGLCFKVGRCALFPHARHPPSTHTPRENFPSPRSSSWGPVIGPHRATQLGNCYVRLRMDG
jgi:hypothetical protein